MARRAAVESQRMCAKLRGCQRICSAAALFVVFASVECVADETNDLVCRVEVNKTRTNGTSQQYKEIFGIVRDEHGKPVALTDLPDFHLVVYQYELILKSQKEGDGTRYSVDRLSGKVTVSGDYYSSYKGEVTATMTGGGECVVGSKRLF